MISMRLGGESRTRPETWASLRAALSELEASRDRSYYDADADHTDADRYYRGSTLTELTSC
jgi:hypothetical protein